MADTPDKITVRFEIRGSDAEYREFLRRMVRAEVRARPQARQALGRPPNTAKTPRLLERLRDWVRGWGWG